MSGEPEGEFPTTDEVVVIAPPNTIIAVPRNPGVEPKRPSDIAIRQIKNMPFAKLQAPQRNS